MSSRFGATAKQTLKKAAEVCTENEAGAGGVGKKFSEIFHEEAEKTSACVLCWKSIGLRYATLNWTSPEQTIRGRWADGLICEAIRDQVVVSGQDSTGKSFACVHDEKLFSFPSPPSLSLSSPSINRF